MERTSKLARAEGIGLSALVWCLCASGSALAQAPQQPTEPATQNYQQDIIVTATRREAGAQSVPLALTAIGGDQLRNTGATNATSLTQLAPSLVVNTDVSAGSPRYSLRGLSGGDVTAAASPSVATYIDDVPQAAQYGIGASLFDLQRVEILRGPQGTTFGKNTTGGAIAYFSQTPTNREEGYVSGRLGGGDRGEQFIEGAVNVPIVNDMLAARVSFRAEEQNTWQRNLGPEGGNRGGGHGFSGRAQLRWTPDSDTWANLTVYLARRRGDQSVDHADFAPLNVLNTASKRTVAYSSGPAYDNFDNRAVTLRVGHDFGAFELTSITHYRHSKSNITQDLDALADDLFFYRSNSKARQYGQEIRLASDATKPLSGLFGLFYEHDRLNENSTEASTTNGPNPLPGPFTYFFDPDDFTQFGGGNGPLNFGDPVSFADYNNPGYYRTITKTYAVFGNLTYKITDALSVTAGVRKTIEKKRFRGQEFYYDTGGIDWTQGNLFFNPATPPSPANLSQAPLNFNLPIKAKPLTWDVTVDYNPVRNLLVFARVAKGFRSGGFNQPAGAFPYSPFPSPFNGLAPVFGNPPTFAGEKLESYEIGVKATPAPWLRINANAYHYDFSNQQVTTFTSGLLNTTNAATSNVDGAELEVALYPTRQLDLSGSLSYNNARYDRFFDTNPDPFSPNPVLDLSGNRLNQAPRWSANWAADYRYPVSEQYNLRMNTTWTYRSQMFFTQSNTRNLSDPSRVLGNARLVLEPVEGKGFSIAAYVNNITNKRPMTLGFEAPAPAPGSLTGSSYGVKYFTPGRAFGLDLSYRW